MEGSNSPIPLSDYERGRAANIERNNARLRELGLISSDEERQSNDAAWKRFSSEPTSDHGNSLEEAKVESRSRKRDHPKNISTEPARKSRRVQGKDPEGMPLAMSTNHPASSTDRESLAQIRERRVVECRQARQLAALRYSKLTDAEKKAAKENPTATYPHCLHRVRTMTEKALYNRVRAIERATGKHCVVKMAIFKSCLQDEGMWDIAAAASRALERLKALQPPDDREGRQV